MKLLENLQVIGVSLCGVSGMQIMEYFRNMQPDLKFAGQTIIGILTIIYLIKKIKRK
jgi:hypothetical protein